jgi:hypothetical protein
MDSEKLCRTVVHVVNLLVEDRYDDLVSLSEIKRVTAPDLKRVVEDYGYHLVMPPIVDLKGLNVREIKGSVPTKWYVGIDLWTTEWGRSDLTLELTLVDAPGNLYLVELDDLHIL